MEGVVLLSVRCSFVPFCKPNSMVVIPSPLGLFFHKQTIMEELGDPSGQDGGAYWDAFFKRVSKGDPFEWYCSTDDLNDVFQAYDFIKEGSWTLHVGSGNSSTLLDLASRCPGSQHVAVDVSQVACDEMTERNTLENVRFIVHDVLNPYPEEMGRFNGALDKGLIDAMMSKCDDEHISNIVALFENLAAVGVDNYICVSLAEEHIVQLIEHVIERTSFANLRVHPLNPKGGSKMRPFCFVLRRGQTVKDITWVAGTNEEVVTFPQMIEFMNQSRIAFANSKVKEPETRSSLVTLAIKPYEAEFDLLQLAENIREPLNRAFGNVVIRESKLTPIGFGISKLNIEIIINDDHIDNLAEFIEDEFEDNVQSVDIEASVSIASTGSLLGNALQRM